MPGFPEQSIARPKNLQKFPPSLPKPINSSTNNQFTNRRILTRAWNSEAMKNVNGFGTRNKTYCLLTTLKTDKDTHKHVGTRAHTHTHTHTPTHTQTHLWQGIYFYSVNLAHLCHRCPEKSWFPPGLSPPSGCFPPKPLL